MYSHSRSAENKRSFIVTLGYLSTDSESHAVEHKICIIGIAILLYTEVKDLRLLGELEQRILETLDQKKGGFTRELSHTITFDGQSSTDTVVDTVATFSNTDKGFSFKAELEDGDVGTKVTR